jgi:hypothetical protein
MPPTPYVCHTSIFENKRFKWRVYTPVTEPWAQGRRARTKGPCSWVPKKSLLILRN